MEVSAAGSIEPVIAGSGLYRYENDFHAGDATGLPKGFLAKEIMALRRTHFKIAVVSKAIKSSLS